jgi:hypothetical protein
MPSGSNFATLAAESPQFLIVRLLTVTLPCSQAILHGFFGMP